MSKEISFSKIEVTSDGKVVWVNGPDKCLARFCKFSTEYFYVNQSQSIKHDLEDQTQDWEDFVVNIGIHFNVDVSEHKPNYIEEGE
jgi:hypothetical protein